MQSPLFHPTTRLAVGNLYTSGLLLPRSQMPTNNQRIRFRQAIHNQLHTIREVDKGSLKFFEWIVRSVLVFSTWWRKNHAFVPYFEILNLHAVEEMLD